MAAAVILLSRAGRWALARSPEASAGKAAERDQGVCEGLGDLEVAPHSTMGVPGSYGTTMAAAIAAVASAGPPVAALAVGVGVGRPLSVGWGVVGVLVGLPVTDGVGVGVPLPAGAGVDAAGVGVGVQATAGRTLVTLLFRVGPVSCWVALTPSGSFHRVEFAVLPPLPRLLAGPAVPTLLVVGLISVEVSWLRMTTPTATMATAAEMAKTGLSQAPADPSRPGGVAAPRCPPARRRPRG
jgi:hypothetical protein